MLHPGVSMTKQNVFASSLGSKVLVRAVVVWKEKQALRDVKVLWRAFGAYEFAWGRKNFRFANL